MSKKRETKSAFGRKPPFKSVFSPVGPRPELIPPIVVGLVPPVVVGEKGVPVFGVVVVEVAAVLREEKN